ncbi:MAG: protein kinase domain-containing protein [Acidobacteriota bacterium]
MATPSDDELARTATAPAAARDALPRAGVLGRFRIERELGHGGMGVVHAAFDPELERRVALKVLHRADDAEARARLLREARAMARLSHPNAITVFEVGSAGGEDFVAMELVDGETLGAWLARERPGWRDIVGAFLAAGRALAAAHAEGLVHRDFKPSNVLRSRGGRIVVTDFGLARAFGDGQPDDGPRATLAGGSGLASRTQTGAVVGTPAYMAPEQWTGGEIGPAADQFAFCVALWEALAGTRPYRGDTIEELKSGVLAGPAQLASDSISRALRAILVRGLAIAPARRFPSMTALLAALERVAHRRRRALAGVAVVALAAAAGVGVLATRHAPADPCAAPAIDPRDAWSPLRAAAIAARSPDTARLVGDDISAWRAARPRACTAPPALRSAQLACLDAALVRLDAAVGGALHDLGPLDPDGFDAVLVDPALCTRSPPPHLATVTPELASAFTELRRAVSAGRRVDTEEVARLAEHGSSPCVRMLGFAARLSGVSESDAEQDPGELMRDLMQVREHAASCDDDALQAMGALAVSQLHSPDELARVDALATTFPSSDVLGELEMLHAHGDISGERWDEAWAKLDHAIELFGKRHLSHSQLEAVDDQVEIALDRGRPEDLLRIDALVAKWRPIATAIGGEHAARLERLGLRARWRGGDVAGADAALERLGPQASGLDLASMIGGAAPIDVTGEVVDGSGAPVAGATVVAAPVIVGDSARISTPSIPIAAASTTSDAAGHFTLPHVRTLLAAQSGELRARPVAPAPHVRLVVEATGRVEGTVELGSQVASHLWVLARTTTKPPSVLVAPVRADGRFSLAGAPLGELQLSITKTEQYDLGSKTTRVVVARDRITSIALAVARRHVDVIAKSRDLAAPDGVLLWVFAGSRKLEHPTLQGLMKSGPAPVVSGSLAAPASLSHVPDEARAQVAADDFFSRLDDLPDGELTICGLPYANKQLAGTPNLVAFGKAVADGDVGCARVAPDQQLVTIVVPSVRKLPAK